MEFEDWLADELPRLLRFATVLCGGGDPAEDVVQDVAIKVHARWDRISSLENPDAYVRRMIVNEHLSWRRKWSRLVPRAELADTPTVGGAPAFDDQYADRAALVDELARLPRRQRAVLVLRYLEGQGDTQIAETLGCSTGTVRSHASRALATLRVEMAPAVSETESPTNETEEDSRAY